MMAFILLFSAALGVRVPAIIWMNTKKRLTHGLVLAIIAIALASVASSDLVGP